MPALPQFNSQRQLTTQQPVVTQQGAGAEEQTLGNAFGAVQDVATKWSNAMDVMQKTTVKANTAVAIQQLEKEAALDPNMNNYDAYSKKLDSLKQEHIKGFNNKMTEQEASMELDYDVNMAKIGIDNIFKKKQLEVGRVSAKQLIDMEQGNYINADNEEARMASATNMKKIIDQQVSAGIFGVEEGAKLYEDSIKEADDAIKDTQALKRVKEKELRLAEEQAKNNNEKNYIKMKVTGQDAQGNLVTREDLIKSVKKDLDSGTVSPEFADSYVNALKSPKAVKAKTIDTDFAEIISDINGGEKSNEAIRRKMLNFVSDGYLSEEDFASADTYLGMLEDKNPSNLAVQQTRKSWLGIEVQFPDKKNQADSRARMSRSFIKKLQSGVDPNDASVEAMREEVLYLLPEAKNHPNGISVIDNAGVKKIIMPNGDIMPSETKSSKKESNKK